MTVQSAEELLQPEREAYWKTYHNISLRYVYPHEMERLLDANGFE